MTHLPKEMEEVVKKEAEAIAKKKFVFTDDLKDYNEEMYAAAINMASFLYEKLSASHPPGVQRGARKESASEILAKHFNRKCPGYDYENAISTDGFTQKVLEAAYDAMREYASDYA